MNEEELKALVENSIKEALNGFEERLKTLESKPSSDVSPEEVAELKKSLEETKQAIEESNKTIATLSSDCKSNKSSIDDIKETYKEQFESGRKPLPKQDDTTDFLSGIVKDLMG